MSDQANELQRRKNELRIKAARFGISTPPEIATELQDIDQVLHLIGLVDTCRRRLSILLRQADQFGSTRVPPHIESEIESTRQTISNYKQQAARLRHSIGDHPMDTAAPIPEPVYQHAAAPEPVEVWRERIEWKLDQILELLLKQQKGTD